MIPLTPQIDYNDDISRDDVFNLTPCEERGGITIEELCGLIDAEWEGRIPPHPPRLVIQTPGLLSFVGMGWSTAEETQKYAKSDPEKIKTLLDKLRKQGRVKRCRAEFTTYVQNESGEQVENTETFEVWARVDPPQKPQDPELKRDDLDPVKRERKVLWL